VALSSFVIVTLHHLILIQDFYLLFFDEKKAYVGQLHGCHLNQKTTVVTITIHLRLFILHTVPILNLSMSN
jgi:hypothetical protein